VIQSSAAALNASRVIHSGGGSLVMESPPAVPAADLMREPPKILVVVCTCGRQLSKRVEPQNIAQQLKNDPLVNRVEFLEQTCTAKGWESLVQLVETCKPNRVLIGACLPYVYQRKLKELAQQVGLDPALIEVVDLQQMISAQSSPVESAPHSTGQAKLNAQSNLSAFSCQLSALQMGIAKIKWVEPGPVATVPIIQKALVIGGGIGGMTAALAIADHGFKTDLVEASEHLGGNLTWLQRTLEGHSPAKLLEDTRAKVAKHPNISVYTQTQVISSIGDVGQFHTTIEGPEGRVRVLSHGVTIFATGGREAQTTSFGYGTSPSIITQKELEQKLADGTMDPGQLNSVVMIQCVDSREEPRNYCSRVCCATALKHALHLKEKNPELSIYILYRDMMSYGFAETYYTRAREGGVIFIQYRTDDKPRVQTGKERPDVTILEPILGRQLRIEADLVVLATGVVSNLAEDLAQNFGASVDQDGFFQEAESKWRPVDALKEGVFACGLTHSPRNIAETITTAEAAAERALRILSYEHLPAGKILAQVHHSLCSLCERCIDACPYSARSIDYDHEKVQINPLMCQGCGACAAVCPNSASILDGFLEQQMFEMIDAAVGLGA
jgi:heterodisulfide reductase subunit A